MAWQSPLPFHRRCLSAICAIIIDQRKKPCRGGNCARSRETSLIEWIWPSGSGVFSLGPEGSDRDQWLVYPALPVFFPSPEFLNLPSTVEDEQQLAPYGRQPVLSADPVFVFQVYRSFRNQI